MNIDEKCIEERELMAKWFNNFFGNIGRRLAQNIDEPNLNFKYFLRKSSQVASITLIPPTANEVFNELNCLKNKKLLAPMAWHRSSLKQLRLLLHPTSTLSNSCSTKVFFRIS